MATYFNLRDKDVSVSDATAIQATLLLRYLMKNPAQEACLSNTRKNDRRSIKLPIFNAKMKALLGLLRQQ